MKISKILSASRENVSESVAVAEEPVKVAKTSKSARIKAMKEAAEDVEAITETVVKKSAKKATSSAKKVAAKVKVAKKTAKEKVGVPEADYEIEKEHDAITKPMAGSLSLVEYSEKCLAVFGDTKSRKDELKALGGRFNGSLHPFGTEERVPGWVFPMKKKAELLKLCAR